MTPAVFAGRTAILGTRHGKEVVVAPLLRSSLGLQVELLHAFDSDRFGTFSGEVARVLSARDTVRAKARAALAEAPHGAFGVASEGSFGPHPEVPFVSCGLELVMLVSHDGAIELLGTDLTLETNFSSVDLRSLDGVAAFAQRAKFPSHALTVKRCATHTVGGASVAKGIREWSVLEDAVNTLLSRDGCVTLETDMRAHLNPTRMQSIARATASLVRAASSACPRCHAPGFVITGVERGLACEVCARPTQRPLAEILVCAGCAYRQTRTISGPTAAPAGQCDWCNP